MWNEIRKGMKKFVSIQIIALSLFGCSPKQDNNAIWITEEPITQTHSELEVTSISTGSPLVSQLDGTLYFVCSNGIKELSLDSKDLVTLIGEENLIYSDLDWHENQLYYTRTMEVYEDSQLISFLGFNEIFRSNLDGNSSEQITYDEFGDYNISISPLGNKMLYTSQRHVNDPQYPFKIMLFDINKHEEEILYSSEYQLFSQWSVLGDKIVIVEKINNENTEAKITFIDEEAKQEIEIFPNLYLFYSKIAWSPDQSLFAIAGKQNFDNKIYIIDSDLLEILSVIDVANKPSDITWSPNGERLLFSTVDSSKQSDYIELWDCDLDEFVPILLLSGKVDGRYESYNALWSADSQYIAYFIRGDDSGDIREMVVLEADSYEEVYAKEFPCDYIWKAFWK